MKITESFLGYKQVDDQTPAGLEANILSGIEKKDTMQLFLWKDYTVESKKKS